MSETLQHLITRRDGLEYNLRRCYENIIYTLGEVDEKRQRAIKMRAELEDLKKAIKKLEE